MIVASKAARWKRSEYRAGEQDVNLLPYKICKHPAHGWPSWRLRASLWSTSWFWP